MQARAVHVRKKAISFWHTLNQQTPEERSEMPTRQFAEDYNRLLQAAKEVAPDVEPGLWSEPVRITESTGPSAGTTISARYIEIQAYVLAIVNLIPAPAVGGRRVNHSSWMSRSPDGRW